MHGGKRLKRSGINSHRTILWSVTILAACGGWKACLAQEWKLETNVSQRAMYTDNLLLSRDNEISAFGSITTPAFHLERDSPVSRISLDGRFEFAEYLNHSNFNSQDQFFNFNVDQATSERSALHLSAGFIRDTTLKSDEDVTGKVLDDSFRFISWNVAPGWGYQLSPLDQIAVRGSYKQNTYDTNNKTDYQYFGPSVDYSHRLSELASVTATVGAYRFIPDEPGDDYTDTISTLLGYAYSSSERFSISGGAGVAYSMQHIDPGNDSSDIGYRLKFNMNYLVSDQTSARVSLSHDTEPSSDGDTVVRNRASVGLSYKVAPLTTLGLAVDYSDNVDILGFEGSSTTDESGSRYTSIRPSIAWQLTEDWSLAADYRFRYRVFDQSGGSTSSNSVFLTLQYNFPTLIGTE